MIRVRQAIGSLVPRGPHFIDILPANISIILSLDRLVRYPPPIYKLSKKYKWTFSHFGIFMEELIRKMLNGNWKDDVYKLFLETAKFYTSDDLTRVVSEKELYSMMGRFVNISKYVSHFKDVIWDVEFIHGNLSGHPDLLIKNSIYDIKTTTKFDSPKMKWTSILQITAYLALARESGYNIKKIGIILPFQQTTLTYHVNYSDYDHTPFLKLLSETIKPKIFTMHDKMELMDYTHLIGNHTPKVQGSVYESLVNFYQDGMYTRPCQIFMRGNRGAKSITLKDDDIAKTLDLIDKTHIRFYVHASYAINLCHPCGNKTKDPVPVPWATNILREDLELTNTCNGKGVVVHTGKGLYLDTQTATNEMYKSVLTVLDSATSDCPLLLETPCDKGSELCGSAKDLADFYNKFSNAQKMRFKICVDTCHVFAAGQLPFDYICELDRLAPDCIGLIHLNDAKWLQGSGKDGHAPVGMGNIGLQEMLKVIRYAAGKGIAMVCE